MKKSEVIELIDKAGKLDKQIKAIKNKKFIALGKDLDKTKKQIKEYAIKNKTFDISGKKTRAIMSKGTDIDLEKYKKFTKKEIISISKPGLLLGRKILGRKFENICSKSDTSISRVTFKEI